MKKSILLFFVLAIFSHSLKAQSSTDRTVLYVNHSALEGGNNGIDWPNAYHDLQTALEKAEYGNQIWVAGGTYLPDSQNDRSRSFVIPPGVKMYGGFEGTEASLEERQPETNPTILSGNIGAPADSTDNTYHVVYLSNPDSNTLIDGFTIMAGYAFGNPGGTSADVGAGIKIEVNEEGLSGLPVISDCQFKNNTARRGGGISVYSSVSLSNGLSIRNTSFENNFASSFGGAMYMKLEKEDLAYHVIEKTRFLANSSGHMGGALYLEDISGKISLQETVFFQSFAQTMGGAVRIVQEKHNLNLLIENADFSNNISFGEGGAINLVCEKPLDIEVEIKEATFLKNRSLNASGGAMNIVNFGGRIDFSAERSDFSENEATEDGAAISIYDELFGTSNIQISHSRIEKNKVTALSGSAYFYNQQFVKSKTGNQTVFYNTLFALNDGAYTYLGSSSGANDTYIYNCTFYNNGNQPIVNWSRLESNSIKNIIHIWLMNTIIWEPNDFEIEDIMVSVAPPDGAILYDYRIDHCIFNARNCEASTAIYDCGLNNLFATDPLFKDPLRGDFRLKACSPAINAGVRNDLFDEFNEGFDLNQNVRIQEDIPDIGAYETSSFKFEVESVQLPDCPGGQDGGLKLSVPVDQAFQINWQTGMSSNAQLTGLSAGNYTFTLTTDEGCNYQLPFTLNGPDSMEVNYTITPAGGPDSRDGGIILGNISGGTAPHRVELFQGEQPFNLGGLAPGTYELRVTDRKGCVISEEIVISFISDVVDLSEGGSMRAFPNPVRQGQPLRLEWTRTTKSITAYRIIDLMGRVVWQNIHQRAATPNVILETQQLGPGLYILQVFDDSNISYGMRIVVEGK